MKSRGFFAVGKPQWQKACSLGLNQAVAFLVLARGSGRDNSTTKWSAEAVSTHTGMSWRRAADAIKSLEQAGLLINVSAIGKRPKRKLLLPTDASQMLWLPNALITGAADEIPPVTRLRQAQNLNFLAAYIELYGEQDLAGDGGLPRDLVRGLCASREHICDAAQFKVWGFIKGDKRSCSALRALLRFSGRKNGDGSAWDFLLTLESLGLLETVDYLTESESYDAELIHPLTGDDYADSVREAADAYAAEGLPNCYSRQIQNYDYTLPVYQHLAEASVVTVWRLVYRPHTKRTAAWLARHRTSCERFKAIYNAIAPGNFRLVGVA